MNKMEKWVGDVWALIALGDGDRDFGVDSKMKKEKKKGWGWKETQPQEDTIGG